MLAEDEFCLNVVVRKWCPELDPSWEFRAFVVDSKLNACTIYSTFTYIPEIAEHAAEIERMIVECWESCKDRIPEPGYTVDFFVTPDLSSVKVTLKEIFSIQLASHVSPILRTFFTTHELSDYRDQPAAAHCWNSTVQLAR